MNSRLDPRPESEKMRVGVFKGFSAPLADRVQRCTSQHFVEFNAIDPGRVEAEDLGAKFGRHLRVTVAFLKTLGDLEGAQRLDLILR